jgi:hypothetical protein
VLSTDGQTGSVPTELRLMSASEYCRGVKGYSQSYQPLTPLYFPTLPGFTSPVYPGQELETKVWHVGEKDGFVEVAFEQTVVGGKKSLGGGYALVRKGAAPAKFRL